MDTPDAIKHMVDMSGLGGYGVSRAAGRANSYVSVIISKQVDPSTRVLADLAHVCGYRLQLVGRGETIDIDGTRREMDDAGEG